MLHFWKVKTFKTKEAYNKWVNKHKNTHQIVEIFVNNAYGVEYRKLRKIY